MLVAPLPALARWALIVLALVLPFELARPVAPLGPLELSSVEPFLYLVVGLWALGAAWRLVARVRARGLRPPAPGWWRRVPEAEAYLAVAAFAVVVLLSAVLAPLARGDATKFALRSLGGMALFLAAADLVRGPRAALVPALAVAVGAVAGAATLLAESHVPGGREAFRPFHVSTFQAFGLFRASGSFQYPNIAAMYLEAVLPLVVTAGVAAAWQAPPAAPGPAPARARWRRLGSAVAALLLAYAISLTASRAGLVAASLVLVALALRASPGDRWRAPALALVAALVALTVTTGASGTPLGARLKFWQDAPWYRSQVTMKTPDGSFPGMLRAGSDVRVPVEVENRGAITWPSGGPWPVHLTYHWEERPSGRIVVFEGLRSRFARDVTPGEAARVEARVRAPARPGRYLLRWDLVHEKVTWFGDRGDERRADPVEVVAAAPGARLAGEAGAGGDDEGGGGSRTPPPPEVMPLAQIPRGKLWRAGLRAFRDHPLLGLGPDNFRRGYVRYLDPGEPGLAQPDERLHSNSLYVETLANLGILGVLAFGALVLALARAARRALGDPASRPLAAGLAAGLGAYLVHGVLDYFFEFTPTYALAWLLAGMLVGLGRRGAEARAEAALAS
jgi:hypothetical protein